MLHVITLTYGMAMVSSDTLWQLVYKGFGLCYTLFILVYKLLPKGLYSSSMRVYHKGKVYIVEVLPT